MLVAGYIGYGYIFYGNDDGGLDEPEVVCDEEGEKIILGSYWDYDENEWVGFGKGSSNTTMMKAVDWDADGDLDLLLSSHPHGLPHEDVGIRLVLNKGSATEPVFSTEQTMVIETNCHCASGITDWDGDGLWDIIATASEHEDHIGIYWYKNQGTKEAPKFTEALPLLSKQQLEDATGYKFYGVYLSVGDYDADGNADLIFGSNVYKEKVLDLSEDQIKERDELQEKLGELNAKMESIYKKYEGEDDEDRMAMFKALEEDEEYQKLSEEMMPLYEKLAPLTPGREQHCPVWVSSRKQSVKQAETRNGSVGIEYQVVPANAAVGDEVTLEVKVKLKEGMHLYGANDPGGQGTKLTIKKQPGLEPVGEPSIPVGRRHGASFWIEQNFVIEQKFKVTEATNGSIPIQGKLSFTACTEQYCDPPAKLKIESSLSVSDK